MNPIYRAQLLARLAGKGRPLSKRSAKAGRRLCKELRQLAQPGAMTNTRGNSGAFLKPAPADERTKVLLARYMARKERKREHTSRKVEDRNTQLT